jgi:multidrug efflux pump
MSLSGWSVHNRTSVGFIAVLVTVAGIYSYMTLPLESSPDITIPYVFISTAYRGASPEDIEKSITIPIEDELQGIPGVKKVTSVSSEGNSFINVEFLTGTDIDSAVTKVKDRVDRAKGELPNDLEDDPVVQELNISEMPILILSLSGTAGLRRLSALAEALADEIEAIPGVLEVEVSGKVEREIQIQLSPERLALYRIPFSLVQRIVEGESQNTSGGAFRTLEGRYQLRVPGDFHGVGELEELIVATVDGAPVYLRDIGKVVDGVKDRESTSRTNGRESVTLAIKKRAGENIVTIVDEVDALVARLQPSWPPGTEVYRMMDQAKDIRLMLKDLQNNILSGLVLVVVIVWAAMGLRNAILVSLSIPLSMLITFVVLDAMGITLNMVVLFSLTLALGMLVDNAVVIVENVYRFMQQGVPRIEAAVAATSEVAWAITGSALTTIAAFVPLLFWEGIMGEFMVFLPTTVIITLVSCLFVALVINPAFAAAFLKADSGGRQSSAAAVLCGGEHPMLSGGGALLRAYRWSLRLALRLRLAVVAIAFGTTVGMALLWFYLVGVETPMEFFPSVDPSSAYVNLKVPKGADVEYADMMVREIAARLYHPDAGSAEEAAGAVPLVSYDEARTLKQHRGASGAEPYESPSYLPDVEHVFEKAGAGVGEMDIFGGSAVQVGLQFVELEQRAGSSREMLKTVEQRMRGIAGAEILVEAQQEGPPTGVPIHIEIAGDDFVVLGRLAAQVKALVQQVQHTQNVRDDFESGAPTISVLVDRKRAGLHGLTTDAVGFALKAAINGIVVTTFREGNEDFDIVVRLTDHERNQIETLRQLFVPTPSGELIPLTTLCDIRYTGGLGRITRIDRRRVVTIKADVDTTRTTGVAARMKAEELLREAQLAAATGDPRGGLLVPPGYRLRFTGEQEAEQESQEFLSWAMGVAILLILLVLILQFNSILMPGIIISAVLLSLAGVFLGLAVCGMPFGLIMTGVGVISLAGVVVNNGIVMLDYILRLLARGMKLEDAIVAGGATRLRPVLLTATTTILGLIPMATGVSFDFLDMRMQWVSESSQWWASMAVAVIFGLGVATVMTLIVVPVLFSLSESLRSGWSALGSGLSSLPRTAGSLWWMPFDRVFGTDHGPRRARSRG